MKEPGNFGKQAGARSGSVQALPPNPSPPRHRFFSVSDSEDALP